MRLIHMIAVAIVALFSQGLASLSAQEPPPMPATIKFNEHPWAVRLHGKAVDGGGLGFMQYMQRIATALWEGARSLANAPLRGTIPEWALSAGFIDLARAAGEKREEAHTKMEALKAHLEAQKAGTLAQGQTKLSPEEIVQRTAEVQGLLSEAKALAGVGTLTQLMERADDADPAAQEILNAFAGEGKAGKVINRQFPKMGDFLRGVRHLTDDSYQQPLSDTQRKYLRAMYKAGTRYVQGEPVNEKELIDSEMAHKVLVGDNTSSAGRGDYLVPTEHMAELLRIMGGGQQFANRARRVPMSRRTVDFPRLVQDDPTVTRPIFSFAAISKIGEGAQKGEREPKFEQLTLTAVKYAAYLEAADELLTDSIVDLPPVLVELLTSAIAYEFDRDTMRGTGVAEPQGFLDHASAWVQHRTTANQVNTDDIFGMEARFFGNDRSIYLYHPSVIPQIYGLTQDNIIAWNPNLAQGAPGVLLGRPLVTTHKLPTLGNKGDLCLVDPMFYIVGDMQRITVMNSIHAAFRNDVTAWRATFRAAGTPWPAGLFSYEASGGAETYRVSPFCVLGAVATS